MQLGTLSLGPYGSLCAHTAFPQREEVEGNEKVCVCVWLLPHQKCQHCCSIAHICLWAHCLAIVAQGDHLQSHLHNDNNKVAQSGCECVAVCPDMCVYVPPTLTHVSIHLVPFVESVPQSNCPPIPSLTPHPVPYNQAPTHLHWHDPVANHKVLGHSPL